MPGVQNWNIPQANSNLSGGRALNPVLALFAGRRANVERLNNLEMTSKAQVWTADQKAGNEVKHAKLHANHMVNAQVGDELDERGNVTKKATGPDGKPITIIRNGQYDDNKESWVPTVENINLDSGSIYLTTEQKIPLEASSTSYKSYSDAPILPKEYNSNQIILSSGRLVLNSSQDHILLSSKLSVGLNAIKSINLDSPKTVITSDKIYLGDKEDTNTQPILLGQDIR